MKDGQKRSWGWRSSLVVFVVGLLILVSGTVVAQAQQSWNQNLNPNNRFDDERTLFLFKNEAVLDKHTGLVWERSPSTALHRWGGIGGALEHCLERTVGGTLGWRVPSVVELMSLLDSTNLPPPFVPIGGVPFFTGVQLENYWTATTVATIPTSVWTVNLRNASLQFAGKASDSALVWCVRGPMNADAY